MTRAAKEKCVFSLSVFSPPPSSLSRPTCRTAISPGPESIPRTNANPSPHPHRLHNRGVDVSDHGISLKTRSRLANRENLLDATQRGFIKAVKASHTSHSTGASPNLASQSQSQIPSTLNNGGGGGGGAGGGAMREGALKRRDSGSSDRSSGSGSSSRHGSSLRAWAHRDRGKSDATL